MLSSKVSVIYFDFYLFFSSEHKYFETNGQKYLTKCVQKYSLNDLITYNSENTDFEIDIFVVPNVCSCSPNKTNII